MKYLHKSFLCHCEQYRHTVSSHFHIRVFRVRASSNSDCRDPDIIASRIWTNSYTLWFQGCFGSSDRPTSLYRCTSRTADSSVFHQIISYDTMAIWIRRWHPCKLQVVGSVAYHMKILWWSCRGYKNRILRYDQST